MLANTWFTSLHRCPFYPHPPLLPTPFSPSVKAGGKRVATKHKHEETDPDAYDQKYVDALPEPQ